MGPDVWAAAIDKIVSTGVVGSFAIVFLILYLRKDKEMSDKIAAKDKELAEERAARISDAKAGYTVLMSIQERALGTADKLADMYQAALKGLTGSSNKAAE